MPVDKLVLESGFPVMLCPLGCGSDHNLNKFVFTCQGCVMELGRTMQTKDLDSMMPNLVKTWERDKNEKMRDKSDAILLRVCKDKNAVQHLQANVSELQLKLEAQDLEMKASKAKVSELEAQLHATKLEEAKTVEVKAVEVKGKFSFYDITLE